MLPRPSKRLLPSVKLENVTPFNVAMGVLIFITEEPLPWLLILAKVEPFELAKVALT